MRAFLSLLILTSVGTFSYAAQTTEIMVLKLINPNAVEGVTLIRLKKDNSLHFAAFNDQILLKEKLIEDKSFQKIDKVLANVINAAQKDRKIASSSCRSKFYISKNSGQPQILCLSNMDSAYRNSLLTAYKTVRHMALR